MYKMQPTTRRVIELMIVLLSFWGEVRTTSFCSGMRLLLSVVLVCVIPHCFCPMRYSKAACEGGDVLFVRAVVLVYDLQYALSHDLYLLYVRVLKIELLI